MTTPQEAAMHKALDALEGCAEYTALLDDFTQVACREAIESLRTALAQQGEQPVAWRHNCNALLTNSLELWIDHCPHCGKPRTDAPAPVAQAPFNESDAAMWLTKNKLTMHETLSAAPVAQPVVECDCQTEFHANGDKETTCGSSQMRRAVRDGHAFQMLTAAPAPQPAQRVAEVPWIEGLPDDATHVSVGEAHNSSGVQFHLTVYAFKYDDGVLKVFGSDNDGDYSAWSDAKLAFYKVPDIQRLKKENPPPVV